MIKGIFRYPGGKSKKSVREIIMARFPDSYTEFRDAMVGGGGIFFAIDKNIKRWANDIDPYLISVYEALKDRPDDFIKSCQDIKPHVEGEELTSTRPGGKLLYNKRLKSHFEFFAKNEECDQALRYFFVHRTVWAGRVNYEIESRMYFSNHTGWNIVNTERLQDAASYLKDAKITCDNYEKVLLEDGNDVLIYVDPPYYLNTNLPTNSQLYRFNFTKEQHIRLSEVAKECKHKVIISYDDDPYIRDLYKGWNFGKSETWTYCGTSSVVSDGQSAVKRQGKELIITNY